MDLNKNKPAPAPAKAQVKANVVTEMADEDDGWGDAWGDEPEAVLLDKNKFDYDKLDLNKLSDFEIGRHKAAMEQDF